MNLNSIKILLLLSYRKLIIIRNEAEGYGKYLEPKYFFFFYSENLANSFLLTQHENEMFLKEF